MPLQDYAQYDGVVVLLQAGTPERPGAILGATRIPLRGSLSDLHRTGFGVHEPRNPPAWQAGAAQGNEAGRRAEYNSRQPLISGAAHARAPHALTFAALLAATSIGYFSAAARRRPREGARAVHQPGLLVVSAGRPSCSPSSPTIRSSSSCRCPSTTGTGSAGRTRSPSTPSPNASGRTRAGAATGKSTRRRRSSTAASTPTAPTARAIDASAETTSDLSVAGERRANGRRHRRVGRRDPAAAARELRRSCCCRISASREVAIGRGENATRKADLHEHRARHRAGRRLERQPSTRRSR